MNRQEVLSANRLKLKTFTGLELGMLGGTLSGVLHSIFCPNIVTVYLKVSDYADNVSLRYTALPIGSSVILGLDDIIASKSHFTDTAKGIIYDLTLVTDEGIYSQVLKELGAEKFVTGCILDNNMERLAKSVIDLVFKGFGNSVPYELKHRLAGYAYLAEPYLEDYGADWLNRFVMVFNVNKKYRSHFEYVLGYSVTDYAFLKWLDSVLRDLNTDYYINNLVRYSLFISDSRLYMLEQLRQFLVKCFRR